jgi:uncharacterized damage-inducible protein DinB
VTDAQIRSTVLAAWRTNAAVTALVVEAIPDALWNEKVPGAPTRSVRMIAAHLHNSRSRWIRTLGSEHKVRAPSLLPPRSASRRALLAALPRSAGGIEALLQLGLENDGQLPPSKGYVWRNLPLDVGHVLAYFVAHEAHHRGQLVMIARQLDHRFPRETVDGLWQWTRLSRTAARPKKAVR